MNYLRSLCVGITFVLISQMAWAQIETPFPRAMHAWQDAVPSIKTEAYFTNLPADGKIETPFVLKFGLSGGWGLAPIAKPLGGKSGHHHLLINTPLPLDIAKPLAFSESYVHFGKGQLETVLNLAPGTHTLRLLLADHQHKLHFVYSKEQTITVTKKNSAIDPKSLVKKGVQILNVASGDVRKTPFRVQFHASGFNVAHMQQKEKDTGHFRLVVTPTRGGRPEEMALVNGQTETWLSPPAGGYKLKLELMSNDEPNKLLAESSAVSVEVQ
jgi:Domain of unknown function (DUF4399)